MPKRNKNYKRRDVLPVSTLHSTPTASTSESSSQQPQHLSNFFRNEGSSVQHHPDSSANQASSSSASSYCPDPDRTHIHHSSESKHSMSHSESKSDSQTKAYRRRIEDITGKMNITTIDATAVIASGGNELISLIKPMRRPGYGTVGRPIKIDTNYFPMEIQPNLTISQFSVKIYQRKHPVEADKATRKKNKGRERISAEEFEAGKVWIDTASEEPIFFNRAIFNMFLARYGRDIGSHIAYDGRSMAYAPKHRVNPQILGHEFRFTVGREGSTPSQQELATHRTIDVKLQLDVADDLCLDEIISTRVDTLKSVNILAAIDNVIANSPMRNFVQVGRSFFNPNEATPLSRNRDHSTVSAWRGFYQSARLSSSGLLLNVDESFTTFWNLGGRSLIELIIEANDGHDPWDDHRALISVAQKLRALKVRALHNGITYKVHGFSRYSAARQTFSVGNGRVISIADYFAETYNRKLRYPQLPCVKTHTKRDTYLPVELLIVMERQRMVGLLTPDQTAVMVRRASTKPAEKKQAALSTIHALGLNKDPMCRDFGIKVEEKLMKVNARVLPPPPILYRRHVGDRVGDVKVNVERGQWRTKEKMYQPSRLLTWIVINEANSVTAPLLDKFLSELKRSAERAGIPMNKPEVRSAARNSVHFEMEAIEEQYGKKGRLAQLQLMLVVKNNSDADTYNKIKQIGDLRMAIPTQVVLARNLRNPRGLNMFCDNVIMKINAKLGGQNGVVGPYQNPRVPDIAFLNTPHIILGADVTHPMPGGRTPSIAALVGSRDRQGVQYSAAIRTQLGKQEIISELGDMFKEVYTHWFNNFGRKFHTRKIVMFRDGVSEGQFSQVMSKEVQSLRQACMDIGDQFSPDITYIIVTKRHHTKLFPDRADADKNGNVQPGTVVDRDITSSEFYDFYLNSHSGIQGTNKPSKYTVLLDESNMTPDALQAFVYRLSHGFVRCNRSVSMVNSAYYAHLLAFRGRAYLGDDYSSDTESTTSSEVAPAPKLDRGLARRLFFV